MDKKVLVVLLAGTMIAASASSLFAADIKFSGDFRVRGFLTDNADGSGDTNDTEAVTDMRFRMKTTATAGMAMAVAVLDFPNGMAPTQGVNDPATLQTTSPAGSGYTRFGSTGFGGANNVVGVREAYLKATWPDWTLAAGRKGTKLGHGIILDDTADTLAAMGKMGGITWGVANLKLFDPQARVLGLAGAAGADTDAYIFHVMGSPMPDNDGSVYIAGIIDRGGTTGGVTRPNIGALTFAGDRATAANLWVIGGTWDGKLSPFTYGFELDILTGKRTAPSGTTPLFETISGLDILAGGGMDLGMGNVGLWLIYGSGQDASSTTNLNVNDISPNYMVGTFLSNNATNTDRDGGSIGNMFAVKLTGAMSPMDKLSTDAALIFASCAKKTRNDAGTVQFTNAGANPLPRPAGTCATDTNLGTELDLNAAYTLADNLSLSGGLGLLFSGNGYKTAAAATSGNAGTQSQLWTTLAYNF